MEEILIIEDDADLREILKFSLERAGYKTREAESAESGLKRNRKIGARSLRTAS